MQKSDIKLGEHYALREPVKVGQPFQQVTVLEHVRGTRWKVEWIDPNPGLVDYVKSVNLIVPWKERRAFLRDEQRWESLARESEREFPGPDSPIARAVDLVLDASGERGVATVTAGALAYPDDGSLDRLLARVRTQLPESPVVYRDRHDRWFRPFSHALVLARALAAAEPQRVFLTIDTAEAEWRQQAREPGKSYLVELINEYSPAWALVRQWAGMDAAVAAREAEIARLERLLNQVMWELRRPEVDPDRLAERIRRGLAGA
jgi:hypothetical protein